MFVKHYSCEENEEIIYFVYKRKIRGEFINLGDFIWNLKIYEKYRGQGYGNKLIAEMVTKFPFLKLMVKTDNTVALHLYQKYGFKITDKYDFMNAYEMEWKKI